VSSVAPRESQNFQFFHPLRRYAVAPLDGTPRPHVEVGKFVILSMLLHVLFVILFGDSTGGGPSRASQMLGGFSASLQARVNNNATAAPSIKSSNANANPRSTNATTPTKIEPLKPSAAPAATPDKAEAIPSTTVPAQSVPEKVSVPDTLPTISTPVAKPVSEFVVAPAETSPKVETVPPVESPTPLPRVQTLAVPKPIELNAAPSVNREFAPYEPPVVVPVLPPTLPASIAPIAPAAPIAPMALPPVTPLALPPIAAPKIEREFAAPANIEVREPLVVPPPINAIAPTSESKTEREFVPPPNVQSSPAPAATTAPPAAAEPSTSTPAERNLTPAPAASTPSTSNAPSSARTPTQSTPGSPAPAKSADDIFGPRRDAVPSAGAPKSLDLDAARKSAREGASESRGERTGPRTLLPFPTAPKPVEKSDMTKIFDRALKRPDCKDAYADLGLAAVVPLVRDAIKQDGCKW
jgi:hypothetical protein